MPALQPEINKIVPPMVVSGTLVKAMSVESESTLETLFLYCRSYRFLQIQGH
jgi:hypothetical protein